MEIVGVTVNFPIPVFAAELKNDTAVGAVSAAGTATGYVMVLVGLVQLDPPTQVFVTPVRDEALVESLCTGGSHSPLVSRRSFLSKYRR